MSSLPQTARLSSVVGIMFARQGLYSRTPGLSLGSGRLERQCKSCSADRETSSSRTCLRYAPAEKAQMPMCEWEESQALLSITYPLAGALNLYEIIDHIRHAAFRTFPASAWHVATTY